MDIKKFEQLMDLVINEDNDRANELFHEIVVERSREIFESIMAEEDEMEDDMMEDDMGGMGGQVGDLLDEINAEEAGVTEEEEDDFDFTDSEAEEDEEAMMEAVQLKKISVTHGDNGVQTKSPGLQGSGQAGMDSHPVKFSGASEAVPTAPKAPSNFYSKGETSVKGAGNFKNSPGKDNFKDKGEAAPKPKHGDDGSNARSPVAESRRPARRPAR